MVAARDFRRMGVDVGQPHMDLGDAVRIGRGLFLREQRARARMSALSTISISGSSVPGASCATWPMRVFFGRPIEPVSDARSPVMARNSVVLPVPLRPTSPALVPAGKVSEAWSRSRRPAMRSERSLMISMAALLHGTSALRKTSSAGWPHKA